VTARVSAAARRRSAIVAEDEILRFAGDHALWHKHIHNVTLDAVQILKMIEMDQNDNTVDWSCRRTGKTFCKELWCLEHLACNAHEEEGIVAPRVQQSLTNLGYHTDAIRRSPILSAFIATKNGRRQLKDTGYQFANGSGAWAYGIMSNIDGDSLTVASLEETDDMPYDRLTSRFLPMLGSTRRPGVDREMKPKIRITGVFKGADVLSSLIKSGAYHSLPVVDVYLGLELGIIGQQWAEDMRTQNSEGEWIRQFLCKNIAAQNWIWEKHVRRAKAIGLQAGIEIAEPLPGARYKRRGLISFGYDHTGHGESGTASKSAIVVMEQIGNFAVIIFCRTWMAGTDDRVIERDLAGLWDYFRPDYAMGDAYGVGMLTSLNDRLYANGLTSIDRRTIGDGQSTASTWGQWPFAPIRFEGQTKHSMAAMLRQAFHHGQAAIPDFDEDDPARYADWIALMRQLPNIKADATKAGYSSFKMADPKIGDDLFDAACAAVWALVTRGIDEVPVVVGRRTQSREALMGTPGKLIEVAR